MSLPKIGVQAVVDNLDGYARGMKAIEKSNDSATDSVKSTAKQFDVLGSASEHVGNIMDYAFGTLIAGAVQKAASFVIGAIGNIINAVGDLAKNIFDSGVTFSGTMANISAVTRITGKDLSNLTTDLIAVGADTAVGPQAVAQAYYDVASGVLDASKRMDVLTASLATAEAGQANLAATTQGVISFINAYGDSVGNATHVSDIFTQTVAVGVGTMDQFVGALTPLAGLAANNKIKMEELGGAMAYMTAKGIPAEQAATAIKAAIVQLSRSTPGVVKALQAMGEKSVAASIANNGLAGTLELLEKGATKTHQNFTTMIGSVEALQAATALGNDDFQHFFDTFIEGVDGATAAARKLQRADVSFQLKLIGSRFQAIGLNISQAVLPAFNKFLTFVNNGFKKIDFKKLGTMFEGLGEKLGKSAEKLIGNFATLLQGVDWDKVGAGIEQFFTNVGDFIANIDWSSIVTGISNAFTTIGNIISSIDWNAVGAGIQGVIKFVGDFSTAAYSLFQGIVSAGQGFLAFWGSLFGEGGSISTPVSSAFASIQTILGNAYIAIVDVFNIISSDVLAIWNPLFGQSGSISTAANDAMTSVTNYLLANLGPITGAFTNITSAVSDLWNTLFGPSGTISKYANDAMVLVTTFIQSNLGPITDAISSITSGISGIWEPLFGENGSIAAPVRTALESVRLAAANIVAGIKTAFAAVANAIIGALTPALNFVNSIASAIRGITAFAGGGGGTPGSAGGGDLHEGLNIVGERGPEAVIKAGNTVTVISADKTKKILANLNKIIPNTKQPSFDVSGLTSNISMKTMMNPGAGGGTQSPYPNPFATAMPISMGGGDTYNSSVTHNRSNNITINGVQDGKSAVEQFSRLTAAGRL